MLDKKVVLITGTAGGLGRVAAQTFAREGAKVIGRAAVDRVVGACDV
jgi:NAD(P)-dependent dehydrogenase (short-subunit alcohol dehydrogenase family)